MDLADRNTELPVKSAPDDQERHEMIKPYDLSRVTKPQVPILRTRPNLSVELRTGQVLRKPEKRVGEERTHRSIVTRRVASVERRRGRNLLIFLAVALAWFPPMWAVYLVAWLVWSSQPKNKSMRRVRQALRALDHEQYGITLKKLQEAHLLDPTNNDALYWLGMLLANQRRYDEAIDALTLVCDRVPGLPEVHTALLECYYQNRAYEEAIHHAQVILETDPYDLPVQLRLADSFAAIGQNDLAIDTLQHAPLFKRGLDESLKMVHYRLGELHEEKGNSEKALEHFRRVYESDISFLDVRNKIQRLEVSTR